MILPDSHSSEMSMRPGRGEAQDGGLVSKKACDYGSAFELRVEGFAHIEVLRRRRTFSGMAKMVSPLILPQKL
jgi:hypothetical protein